MASIDTIVAAHGFIMAVSFLILFPAGALIIRLLTLRNTVWIHVFWQIFAYLCVLSGLGLGAWVATTQQEWLGPLPSGANNGHPIIGTIVVGTLLLMPFTGLIHHNAFKVSRERGGWAFLHMWIGRVFVLLGIINGGLGIQLSGEPGWAIPAYSTVAGVAVALWIAANIYNSRRRKNVT